MLLNTTPGKTVETCPEFLTACAGVRALLGECPCPEDRIRNLVRTAIHFLRKAEQFDYFNFYGLPFITEFAGALFGWNIRFLLSRTGFPVRRILVLGETGSGKEQVARLAGEIIAGFNKAQYLAVNAANLSETLLEAELFGHEKGVYTGAHVAREGIIRQLDGGGVLFLDEISETPPSIQARLLRFLETGEYRPLGSRRTEYARISVIAASNRIDLHQDSDFRSDLLYRLSESVIRLPPLRQIVSDPDRAVRIYDHLITSAADDMTEDVDDPEKQAFTSWVSEWSKTAARHLASEWSGRSWPGNIRECKNEIRQLIAATPGRLEADSKRRLHPAGRIPSEFETPSKPGTSAGFLTLTEPGSLQTTPDARASRLTVTIRNPEAPIDLLAELESVERNCYHLAACTATSIDAVARFLGVTRQTASRRMRAFGIRLHGPGCIR